MVGYFNPRSLAGATLALAAKWKQVTRFQSTLPRGSDLDTGNSVIFRGIFQSTLPRGSDEIKRRLKSQQEISIHAPSRERPRLSKVESRSEKFQSTLPRGSDVKKVWAAQLWKISIHAPSRERHKNQPEKYDTNGISIHAPSRERPKRSIAP